MNIPPKEFIRVPVEALHSLSVALLERSGVPAADARTISDLLIDTDLRGVWSHGTNYLNYYCTYFLNGMLNPRPKLRIVNESPTTVIVDGDGGIGHLAAQRMTELVIAKAKVQGVAVGTTRNHGHIGSAGKYVRQAVRRNCAAWCTSGSITQKGWKESVYDSMGDPPVCFGVPGGKGPPVIPDMGARFFYDPPGKFAKRFAIHPSAYFKSLGLAAMSHLLSVGLSGMPLVWRGRAKLKYAGASQGSFLCVIDIARFRPVGKFRAEVDRLTSYVGTLRPMPGYKKANLPGRLEWEHERDYTRRGIPVGRAHQKSLEQIAKELGVPVPW
jgi:LDH2 family malate/lactate/ureidoglycolate dehydrogenase